MPTERPRGLSLDSAYLSVALAMVALRPLLTPVPPNDFWWHMAEGRLIARTGQIPRFDTFSYLAHGRPFYLESWLSELLMFALHQAGGLPLIIVVQALVIVVTYGLVQWVAARRSGQPRWCAVLLLLAIMPESFSNWLERPQAYAFPLFALYLTILTGHRLQWWKPVWPLWLLPPLMVVWVNLHGSFVLGLVLLVLTWTGEALERTLRHEPESGRPSMRPLAIATALSAAAILVNPRGVEVLGYVYGLLSSKYTTIASEWASPSPHNLNGALFYAVLIVLILALIYARRRPTASDMVLLVPFLWLALSSERYIVWFGMVSLPILAEALATLRPAPAPRPDQVNVPNAALAAIVWLLVVPALPWVKPVLDLPAPMGLLLTPNTPIRTVRALQALPAARRPRRLFHDEAIGSYLIWAAPEQPVFIDARFELYPFPQWMDFLNLNQGCHVPELFAKYRFDGLLLDRERQRALLAEVLKMGGWKVEYQAGQCVLLLKH